MAKQNPGPPPNNVKYVDIRDQIKDGDLILWRGTYLTSRIFEFLDGSFYSHAAVVAWWGERLMVMQAERELQAIPLSVAISNYPGRVDYYRLKREMIPDAEGVVLRALKEARSDLGLPFGVSDLLKSFWNQISRIAMRDAHAVHAMYCSEYVERCFRLAGRSLTDQPDEATLPQMIADSKYVEYKATVEHNIHDVAARDEDDVRPT